MKQHPAVPVSVRASVCQHGHSQSQVQLMMKSTHQLGYLHILD